MSVRALKSAVTTYFKGRRAMLKTLSDSAIRGRDDFFELYVLVLLAKAYGRPPMRNTRPSRRGGVVFSVAASPSPKWLSASYFALPGDLGLRTGLSVQATPATAELDVIIADLTALWPDEKLPASAARAGIECKAHKGRLNLPVADSILGKAFRVWTLPVARLKGPGRDVEAFAVVTLTGVVKSANDVLRQNQIAVLTADDRRRDLQEHVRALVAALSPPSSVAALPRAPRAP